MKVVVVHNPKSGHSPSSDELRAKFAEYGMNIEQFVMVDDGLKNNLRPFAKSAAHIAVIGGDGTLSAVAGIVAGSQATLLCLVERSIILRKILVSRKV